MGEFSIPLGNSRSAYFGDWRFEDGRFTNCKHMQQAARNLLQEFQVTKTGLAMDEPFASKLIY